MGSGRGVTIGYSGGPGTMGLAFSGVMDLPLQCDPVGGVQNREINTKAIFSDFNHANVPISGKQFFLLQYFLKNIFCLQYSADLKIPFQNHFGFKFFLKNLSKFHFFSKYIKISFLVKIYHNFSCSQNLSKFQFFLKI